MSLFWWDMIRKHGTILHTRTFVFVLALQVPGIRALQTITEIFFHPSTVDCHKEYIIFFVFQHISINRNDTWYAHEKIKKNVSLAKLWFRGVRLKKYK